MYQFKHEPILRQLYSKPPKEAKNLMPHYDVRYPNQEQQLDVLYLPNDNGFGYLLTLIDCHNGLCDARALAKLKMDHILHALEDIYDTSMYLSYPTQLDVDH